LEWSLGVNGLSRLFALVVCGMGVFVFGYAAQYLAGHERRGACVGLLAAFMVSMLGVVLAGDLATLFVAWELTSVTSFLLIGIDRERASARQAAVQAFVVTGVGALAMLAGFLLLHRAAGTWRLEELPDLSAHPSAPWIVGLIATGAMAKSAQVPFHFWLPSAMEAPTPVSAYLHSATMVKAGVFLLLALEPVLGESPLWTPMLSTIGCLTALAGAHLAWQADDLKRMLAGTTVSSLGLMVALVGLSTQLATGAALVFLLGHCLYKGALFMVAGNLTHITGEKKASRLRGLGKKYPTLWAAALVAELGLAGFGPVLAFVGKEVAFKAAPMAMLAALAVASPMLVACAWRLAFAPFLGPPPPDLRPLPWAMAAPPAVLGLMSLAGGFAPAAVQSWLIDPVVGPGLKRFSVIPELDAALLATVLALLAGIWLALRTRPGDQQSFAEQAYGKAMAQLARTGAALGSATQDKPVRKRILVVILAAASLLALGFRQYPEFRFPEADLPPVPVLLVALLVAGGAVATVFAPTRISGIVSLGVTGLGLALLYLLIGAPDLAMTQLTVEIVTVVVFVLVFHHLPRIGYHATRTIRVRDALASVVLASLLTLALLAVAVRPEFPKSADFYAASSMPLALGKNVVNTIIVDFRALDTLGEVTVLAAAALGVTSLFGKSLPDKEKP
jgi:multicomponent Na+:H+ antiporter subunit A